MARLTILLFSFALLAPSPLALLAQDVPEIEVSIEEWDFGRRDQGEKDQKTFIVKNVGKADLELVRLGVTCGCISISPRSATLAPGESLEAVVDLDTSRVSGEIKKHVFIDSNAPDRRKVMIDVYGTVEPLWWFSTRSVNFGDIELGAEAAATMRLHLRPGAETELLRVVPASAHVAVQTTPFGEVEGDHGWELTLKLSNELPVGAFRSLVTVELDTPFNRNGNVPIYANVLGPLAIRPDRINFGGVPVGDTSERRVRFEKRRGDGLVLEKVTCTEALIALEVVEVEKGRTYELVARLTPDGKRRRITGRIFVFTNEPQQKVVPIYYQSTVRP